MALSLPHADPSAATDRGRTVRALCAASVAVTAGIVAVTAVTGLTGSLMAAVGVASLTAVLGGWVAWKRPLVDIDEAVRSRGVLILSGLATIAALVQLVRLAVFMIDPSQVAFSSVPGSAWEVQHSCMSAYFVAGEAAGRGHDPYDDSLYSEPTSDPAGVRTARTIGPFRVDVYEYPPPFLLLPRACTLLVPDFLRQRILWFALNLAIVLVTLAVVARALGPGAATRAVLLSPLVLAALPTLSALQKGNIQLVVIALSMLSMVFFDRRRWAAGGALLAFTTVGKLFPALLVLYVLGRRQWRALAWTVGAGAAYVVLTLLDLGWAPFRGFLAHLPGLLGGEAFPAFRNPAATAINFSIPGLVFKLKLFDVPGMGFVAARIVGSLSTLVVVCVLLRAARSTPRASERPLVWLAILILASLCSPFLPQAYAAFPPLWMLTLLAATYRPTPKVLSLVVLGWLGLNVFWPLDWPMDHRLLAVLTLLPQAMTVALAVLGFRRRVEPVSSVVSSAT